MVGQKNWPRKSAKLLMILKMTGQIFKVGQSELLGKMKICLVCKSKFKPIYEQQKFCSGTCCRAVKDMDELRVIYAIFDEWHQKAFEAQMEKFKNEQTTLRQQENFKASQS